MASAINVGPEQLQYALQTFLYRYPTTEQRIAAVKQVLQSSPAGRLWRQQLGRWATWLVPVEELVPQAYRHWRPLVRDAMQFVVSRLSAERLAPKVVEQIELPPDMPAEQRLLRLITRVPGLQKIGQVLARNRHFEPRFRRALAELENGISDTTIGGIRAVIAGELGPRIRQHRVRIGQAIFSEASVSAVVRFSWRNPETGKREPGVFKVLKPHIPQCYAEDMKILQQLAGFLARRYVTDRHRFAGLADTLTEIRLLLAHEVDFRREQATLPLARQVYGSVAGVRIPRLIAPLSSDTVTALSLENGVKVTDFRGRQPARARVAERLAEAFMAVPAFSRRDEAIFHGDPHAGNVLYDQARRELVLLDWALTERLAKEQRRHLAMLVLMTVLRDADGMCRAVDRVRLHRGAEDALHARAVRACVNRFLAALPLGRVPGAMDAMNLLDEVAKEGIRFPAALVMFRKATFTLDGVLEDVAGAGVRLDSVLARYALKHWAGTGAALWSLFSAADWIRLEWSALTFISRLCLEAVSRPLRGAWPALQAAADTPLR